MTTTFATPPGPAATSDPTDVMGKRIGAWAIDALLASIIILCAIGLTGEYKQIDDGYDGDEAEFCQDILDSNSSFDGNCISPPFGDRVYLIEYSDTTIYTLVALAWVTINMVILQGATGASIGKRILGLRVVDRHGAIAGVGKSALRTVLLIIDGQPGVPIVGGIVAWTSNGHRRVGDMAAGTFVVGTNSVGYPVNVPAVALPPGANPWGAAPPGPPAQPQAWGQPAAPQWGQAPPETQVDTPEVDLESIPADREPFDPTATVAGAHAPWADTAPPTPEPAQAQAAPDPQWDEARGTYIQWDPSRGAWLQWDNATNAWVPIS